MLEGTRWCKVESKLRSSSELYPPPLSSLVSCSWALKQLAAYSKGSTAGSLNNLSTGSLQSEKGKTCWKSS